MENSKWEYCNENDHEYSDYINILGKSVCFTCDPLSSNNWHRPAAKAEVARLLNVNVQFFSDNPVWFLDLNNKPVGFKESDENDYYYCPFCGSDIRFYSTGPSDNLSLKWACGCN